MLLHSTAHRQRIVAIDARARAAGIRVGTFLPQARAICPTLRALEHHPEDDRRSLLAVARWLLRYTPIVSLGPTPTSINAHTPARSTHDSPRDQPDVRHRTYAQGEQLRFEGVRAHPRQQIRVRAVGQSHTGRSRASSRSNAARSGDSSKPLRASHAMHASDMHDAIYLDLAGTERLFGPIESTAHHIAAALDRWGISAQLAVAHTPAAAWAMSHAPALPHRSSRSSTSTPNAIAPVLMDVDPHRIPLHGLGLPDEVVATLRHLGLRSLAELQRVPRAALPDRFGSIILLRLDQIEGRIHEPLPTIEVLKPISLRERWDSAVDGIEPLHPLFEQLVDRACALLTRRGHAARRVVVTLRRYRQAEITLDLPFSIPTRDPHAILRLLRLAIDREMLPIKRRASVGIEGFVGIDLLVPETTPHRQDQPDLPGANEGYRHDPLAVHRLAEGLRARLGSEAIRAIVPHESHLPERSWREVDVVDADAIIETNAKMPNITRSSTKAIHQQAQNLRAKHDRIESAGLAEWFMTMFDPREIRVIVSPSHDRDGRPVQVGIGGQVQRVVACRGPHRIAGEWWRGHDKTRDYFDIELEDHRRLLVFRVCDNARWFVQGENG